MFKKLFKLFTKNYTRIPLFWASINYNKYKDHSENSCDLKVHPNLKIDNMK